MLEQKIDSRTRNSVFCVLWTASWQDQQNECAHSEDSDQPGHPLAQWLEHCIFDQDVLGSNPVGVESFSAMPYFSSLRLSYRKSMHNKSFTCGHFICICFVTTVDEFHKLNLQIHRGYLIFHWKVEFYFTDWTPNAPNTSFGVHEWNKIRCYTEKKKKKKKKKIHFGFIYNS